MFFCKLLSDSTIQNTMPALVSILGKLMLIDKCLPCGIAYSYCERTSIAETECVRKDLRVLWKLFLITEDLFSIYDNNFFSCVAPVRLTRDYNLGRLLRYTNVIII